MNVEEPEPTQDVEDGQELDLGDLMEGEWSQHFSDNGEPVADIETNGLLWRCTICLGTEQEWISNSPTGIAGHRRIRHSEHDFYTPEIIARRTDSLRFNRLSRQIEEAVTTLARTIGMDLAPADRVAQLEAELDQVKKERDEAKARLELIREAYGA